VTWAKGTEGTEVIDGAEAVKATAVCSMAIDGRTSPAQEGNDE
jgi:hypothetical protein